MFIDPPDFENFNPDEYDSVEVHHSSPTTPRGHARRIALQVLYELDTTTHGVGDVMTARLDAQEAPSDVAKYVRLLVTGVVEERETLDVTISRYAPEYPTDQIAIVDRNILRIGMLEMQRQIPIGAAIDEAVQLATVFGSDASPRFINGVLGSYAKAEHDAPNLETTSNLLEDEDLA